MTNLPAKISRWLGYDKEAHKYTYQPTEDYLWGPPGYKERIGDMDREGLLRVIATGYIDREELAQALVVAVAPLGENIPREMDTAVSLARLIVKRINEGTSE
jgi:hypothetical protein